MNDVVLCVDENDDSLGCFFRACADKTKEIICSYNREISIVEISGKSLNEIVLKLKIKQIRNKEFLFLAFSHGTSKELLCNGNAYLSVKSDKVLLRHYVSYHFSCYTGFELGSVLIDSGTKAFLGYNNSISAQNFVKLQPAFVKCAVSGIKPLLAGNSIKAVYYHILNEYDNSIDEVYLKDFFSASFLLENRDALIVRGDLNLKV